MTASGSTPKQLTQQQSTALANALLRGVDAAATPHNPTTQEQQRQQQPPAVIATAAAHPDAANRQHPARSLLQAVVDAAANSLAPRTPANTTASALVLLSPGESACQSFCAPRERKGGFSSAVPS